MVAAVAIMAALGAPTLAGASSHEGISREIAVAPSRDPKAKRWYGWEILLADSATLATAALLLSADESGDGPAPYHFVGGYVSAAPITHLAHENIPQAGISLGMRATLPLLGGLAGCAMSSGRGDLSTCDVNAFIGALLGMAVATTVDAAALSWAPRAPSTKSLELAPMATITTRAATFGLSGLF